MTGYSFGRASSLNGGLSRVYAVFPLFFTNSPRMAETKSSTGGTKRYTSSELTLRARLFAFVLILCLGAVLLGWIKLSAGSQIKTLQGQLAEVQEDRFSLSTELRACAPRLNALLLKCWMDPTPSNKAEFTSESKRIESLLSWNASASGLSSERQSFSKMLNAYAAFAEHGQEVVLANDGNSQRPTFAEAHAVVEQQSAPLVAAIDEFTRQQNQRVATLFRDTRVALDTQQRLTMFSMLLLMVISVALAWLGYQGVIAPLRNELSETQSMVRRHEKLASLGVLAAGVAHEIRNPLMAIKFRLFSLKKTFPLIADNEDTTVISTQIDRLDRIVKDFLQFARPSDPNFACTLVDQVIQRVSQLLAPQFSRRHVELKMETNAHCWVQADPHQLEQVLINLAQNSAESIHDTGTVWLRCREQGANGKPFASVIIEVADTGKGIPPEVEKRLYDPFFTTKENGTGLGLAIAARIVEKHGGLIRHATQLNSGTTFQIVLPALETYAREITAH